MHIAVCYSLEKSKNNANISPMEIKQNCMESNQYIITKKEINELNNISIVEDKQIKRQEYFKINC